MAPIISVHQLVHKRTRNIYFRSMNDLFQWGVEVIGTLERPNVSRFYRIWYKAGLEEEVNVMTLMDDLQILLNEMGAAFLSSRTLKFLSLDPGRHQSFFEQYRRLPLMKINAITIIGSIKKDCWTEISCSYLVIGTESGEILILDHRAFFVVDKQFIGWPPVAFCSLGLWAGEGQIIIVGRDGKIGAIKRGTDFELWETVSDPVVAVDSLACEGVAVVTMNGVFLALSKKGVKLWKVQLPGSPLDMVNLSITESSLSLLAISIAGFGVRVYDQKHHVDTIKTLESVSSLKYGRLGQEERAMAMLTCSGGLNVKILKRTADFSGRSNAQSNFNLINLGFKFLIPKKNKLFIEQTIRERSDAIKIHTAFQQGFLRLRLDATMKACNTLKADKECDPVVHSLQSSALGFGPNYIIKILVINTSEGYSTSNFFLVCRDENLIVLPRIVKLPLLTIGIPLPITLLVTPVSKLISKMQILLCIEGQAKPLTSGTVSLPVVEDIEI